jgi:H+/gluconate symporter-like permease
MADRLGPRHAVLAVVLAGAFVTYGGVSLFVAFFVLKRFPIDLNRWDSQRIKDERVFGH